MNADISTAFVPNRMDSDVAMKLIKHDNTNSALKVFRNNRQYLSDYVYWFFLSTLWVQRSGATELEEWKRLFSADRPDRERCIMKPSELAALQAMPQKIIAYRAHRPGELDWIAYTINVETAVKFAIQRKVDEITEYEIDKSDVLAYFTRRGEYEILLLDKTKAIMKGRIKIIIEPKEGEIEEGQS